MPRYAVILILALAPTAAALEYVEAPDGLQPPSLDGGRTEFELADVDLDGWLDIVSIGDHGSPHINTDQHGIMVWFGSPDGVWSIAMTGEFGYGGIAVGDVNGDGLPDVGYGMHHDYSGTDLGDQLIEVALGDGTGTSWTPWDDGLATSGESWGMFGTDLGDVDNDGDLDVASNSFGASAGVHVYLNQGDGTWAQSFGFLGGNSTMDLVMGDVNGDGNLDLAASQQYGTVYLGDGAGDFALNDAGLPPTGSMGRAGVSLGDVDADGAADLAFVDDGGVRVFSFDPDLAEWQDLSGALPASGSYQATQLVDLDGDGHTDVAAFGSGQFTAWLGDGQGGWTAATAFSTPSSGTLSAFRVGGDTDHNGRPDIVLSAREGSWPSDHNVMHFFRETAAPDHLAIAPLHPRGGERLPAGSTRFVDWATAVPGNSGSRVRLELSTTGDTGPWMVISDDLPDNGRHQWTVPLSPTVDARLRLTVWTADDTAQTVMDRSFTILGGATAVGEVPRGAIRSLAVAPNPFNPRTEIRFELATSTRVRLTVYDLAGRRVATPLAGAWREPGAHAIVWDGRDDHGRDLASGTYRVELRADGATRGRSVTLIR